MSTKGFPELQQLYATARARRTNVMLHRGEHFPHNYNAVSPLGVLHVAQPALQTRRRRAGHRAGLRAARRASSSPCGTRSIRHRKATTPISSASLLSWFADDADKQLHASRGQAGRIPRSRRRRGGNSHRPHICHRGRRRMEIDQTSRTAADYLEMTGVLRNNTYGEELPVVWLYPKKWNGRVDRVARRCRANPRSLTPNGAVKPAVRQLVDAGQQSSAPISCFRASF